MEVGRIEIYEGIIAGLGIGERGGGKVGREREQDIGSRETER